MALPCRVYFFIEEALNTLERILLIDPSQVKGYPKYLKEKNDFIKHSFLAISNPEDPTKDRSKNFRSALLADIEHFKPFNKIPSSNFLVITYHMLFSNEMAKTPRA